MVRQEGVMSERFPRFPGVPGTARPAIGSRGSRPIRTEPEPEPVIHAQIFGYRFPRSGTATEDGYSRRSVSTRALSSASATWACRSLPAVSSTSSRSNRAAGSGIVTTPRSHRATVLRSTPSNVPSFAWVSFNAPRRALMPLPLSDMPRMIHDYTSCLVSNQLTGDRRVESLQNQSAGTGGCPRREEFAPRSDFGALTHG